jgi:uncharacterized protein YunC (DUF1805 family)
VGHTKEWSIEKKGNKIVFSYNTAPIIYLYKEGFYLPIIKHPELLPSKFKIDITNRLMVDENWSRITNRMENTTHVISDLKRLNPPPLTPYIERYIELNGTDVRFHPTHVGIIKDNIMFNADLITLCNSKGVRCGYGTLAAILEEGGVFSRASGVTTESPIHSYHITTVDRDEEHICTLLISASQALQMKMDRYMKNRGN